MLNEKNKVKTIYACEFYGFGYVALENAERCEQYCYTHGSCSAEIIAAPAGVFSSVSVIGNSSLLKRFAFGNMTYMVRASTLDESNDEIRGRR